ncbi:DUF2934 domain-containing protein [Chthonobacter albigriseus]|uniref:DUF2934 domain-containing protein n=1 Tax=Chthonobacter albigriseus TaxID=1683161 RepID=UPI0015EF5965|nr:DUF2934 domain-containing protein [Chthonobacter albigriseus]
MIDDDERRIREKAYELWVAEGKPEGRADAHWEEAREIIAIQDAFETTLIPVEESTRDVVEPAIAFENQGEFPDLADEGEGKGGPSFDNLPDAAGTQSLTVEDAPKPAGKDRAKAAPAKAARQTGGRTRGGPKGGSSGR